MPETVVRVFRRSLDDVPVREWLLDLKRFNKKVFAKMLSRIIRLGELGHELHVSSRKEAAHLEDGIFELRMEYLGVQYRILYFFHKQEFACLSHGLTKEDVVPPNDIERAKQNRALVRSDPDKYTADFDLT